MTNESNKVYFHSKTRSSIWIDRLKHYINIRVILAYVILKGNTPKTRNILKTSLKAFFSEAMFLKVQIEFVKNKQKCYLIKFRFKAIRFRNAEILPTAQKQIWKGM